MIDVDAHRRWLKATGRTYCVNRVQQAIRDGVLPRLDGSIPCADCRSPARDYDHRDYNKPLEVEPVCRSCNVRRGPGIDAVQPYPRKQRAA